MYPSVIYKNCRRGKEAFGAWQHRTVDLSDLFKLEPYLGFLKLHCGLVACFLVLGFVKVKINGLEYYQALCVYLDTESVSSFWETQYSRLFSIQSLIGLLRSSIVIPVSLHRLVMNRIIVVKYGVGRNTYHLPAQTLPPPIKTDGILQTAGEYQRRKRRAPVQHSVFGTTNKRLTVFLRLRLRLRLLVIPNVVNSIEWFLVIPSCRFITGSRSCFMCNTWR